MRQVFPESGRAEKILSNGVLKGKILSNAAVARCKVRRDFSWNWAVCWGLTQTPAEAIVSASNLTFISKVWLSAPQINFTFCATILCIVFSLSPLRFALICCILWRQNGNIISTRLKLFEFVKSNFEAICLTFQKKLETARRIAEKSLKVSKIQNRGYVRTQAFYFDFSVPVHT